MEVFRLLGTISIDAQQANQAINDTTENDMIKLSLENENVKKVFEWLINIPIVLTAYCNSPV